MAKAKAQKDIGSAPYNFPQKLIINTDGNILELSEVASGTAKYIFTKSQTNKGKPLHLTGNEVQSMLRSQIAVAGK